MDCIVTKKFDVSRKRHRQKVHTSLPIAYTASYARYKSNLTDVMRAKYHNKTRGIRGYEGRFKATSVYFRLVLLVLMHIGE